MNNQDEYFLKRNVVLATSLHKIANLTLCLENVKTAIFHTKILLYSLKSTISCLNSVHHSKLFRNHQITRLKLLWVPAGNLIMSLGNNRLCFSAIHNYYPVSPDICHNKRNQVDKCLMYYFMDYYKNDMITP